MGLLALGACGPVIEVDEDSSSGESSTSTGVFPPGRPPSGTSPASTANPSSTTMPNTTLPSDPGDPSFPTTVGSSTRGPFGSTSGVDPSGGNDTFGNGESCMMDGDCMSGHCYVLGILGGICGECGEDSDCLFGGCTLPNPLARPPEPSRCNVGELGAGCENDVACSDELQCAVVLDVPGVLLAATCSECESDSDCEDGQLCGLGIDITELSGLRGCVTTRSVPNNSTCDLQTSGDLACASGICAATEVQGVFEVGVCGECETNADCNGGLGVCTPGQGDLTTGVTGSVCTF